MDARIDLLLTVLAHAYEKSAWHGTTLRGSLRGLKPERALWRPEPDRHCIWDYLLHAAYWKFTVRRWVSGERSAKFDRRPSNWPATGTTQAELKRDVRFLHEEHGVLRAAIERFDPKRLEETTTARGPTYLTLIHGIAAHDLYHTGQIQLLKRLAPAAATR